MPTFEGIDAVNVIVAVVLVVIWAFVAKRYYGPAKPLTKDEIDKHVERLLHMFMTVGVPDGNGGGDVEKALDDFREFAQEDDGKPFYMVNLMKWRDKALFNPAIEGVDGLSVKDADLAYNEKLFYELTKNAGHAAYLSSAFKNAFNFGLTDESDNWGEVAIFRYSSRRDFLNMISSESYRNIVYFKLASMGQIALVPTQPHGLFLNPMPNIPVLLGGISTIGYLLLLLLR
jgi:hypothetical protein